MIIANNTSYKGEYSFFLYLRAPNVTLHLQFNFFPVHFDRTSRLKLLPAKNSSTVASFLLALTRTFNIVWMNLIGRWSISELKTFLLSTVDILFYWWCRINFCKLWHLWYLLTIYFPHFHAFSRSPTRCSWTCIIGSFVQWSYSWTELRYILLTWLLSRIKQKSLGFHRSCTLYICLFVLYFSLL